MSENEIKQYALDKHIPIQTRIRLNIRCSECSTVLKYRQTVNEHPLRAIQENVKLWSGALSEIPIQVKPCEGCI